MWSPASSCSPCPARSAGTVAWRLTRGSGPGRALYVCLLAVMVWQVVRAVAELLGGDPRGLTSMALPLAIVILAARRSGRRYLRAAKPAAGSYGAGDRGASLIEYAGLIVLAALILGSLVALGLPSQVRTGTGTALCRIFSSGDCAQTARRGPAKTDPNGLNPNGDNPTGGKPAGAKPAGFTCHGFFDCVRKGLTTDPYDLAQQVPCTGVLSCAIHGYNLLDSAEWNVQKAIIDDAKGIVDLVKDPTSLADAARYIRDHPGDALRQLVWDDESTRLWHHGNYIGAVSRTIWNVGSWILPGVDIGKALSKTGKFAKLGKLANKTGELGRLARSAKAASKAADKAKRLAAKGDAKGARAAANEARRNADAAARQARKDGCAVALPLHAVRVSPHFGRFGAAALPACAMGEPEGVRKAREAAKRAEKQAERAGKAFVPAPKKLNPKAFPGTRRVAEKTSRQGGGSLRRRWKDGKGNIYEWDYQHGAVEKYNKRGRHLGEYDPRTGEQTKPADPSRHVDP